MLRPACWAYAACGLLCGPTPLSLRERDGVPSYIESTVDGQGWSMTVRRPSLLTPSKSSVSRGVMRPSKTRNLHCFGDYYIRTYIVLPSYFKNSAVLWKYFGSDEVLLKYDR